MPALASRPSAYALRWTPSYLSERHSRSTKTLSSQRPRPSIETRTPAGEGRAGELAALIGVEDLGLAEARERLVQRVESERHVHAVPQPPRQHRPARPVDDRDQVKKPTLHREIGEILSANCPMARSGAWSAALIEQEGSAMSLRPEPIGAIPAETARVARAAFPKGRLVMRLRDEFRALRG